MIIDVSEAVLELEYLFNQVSKSKLRYAISRALNDSIKQSRTIIKRGITDVYNIKSSYLASKNLPIKKAKSSSLISTLSVSNKPIPIGQFKGVRQILGRGKRRGGVTVPIKKGNRKKLIGAFLMKGLSGDKSVLHRAYLNNGSGYKDGLFQYRNKRLEKTGSDIPIASMLTVSPFTAAVNKSVIDKASNKANNSFKGRLEYHLKLMIAKAN